MILTNNTRFPTRELRKILVAVHAATAASRGRLRTWDQLRIRVVSGRRRGYWGCATYSGYNMTLTVPPRTQTVSGGPHIHWTDAEHCNGPSAVGVTEPKRRDRITTLDVPPFVALVQHELWHNYGIRHGDMPNTVRYCSTDTDFVRQVVADLGFDAVEEISTPEPPDLDDKRASKLASLDERIARWEGKLRRAENAIKKLRRQRRYYERVVAPKGAQEAA